MDKIENLVFSSGGIMGYAFLGAYKYLDEKNKLDNLKQLIGCSIGSMMSLSISLGYSSSEIEKISCAIDFSKIVNIENNILDIIDNYGYDNGEHLIKIVKALIKQKTNNPDLTFREHFEMFNKKLIIVGCNVNKNQDEYFNYKTQPDMKIWEAVRISCGIPIIFTPYKYNNCLYVDGALGHPCPSNYFKNQNNTLSFLLECQILDNIETTDFKSYLSNIILYNLRCNKKKKTKKKNSIVIYCEKGETLDSGFSVSNEMKKKFIENGYNSTKLYFEKN
jgi:NTE family protein